MIRAKFSCWGVFQGKSWVCDPVTGIGAERPTEIVKFCAASGGPGSENAKWSEASPSGSLEITIANSAAQGVFKPGQSYYLDFTPAPA